MPKVKRPKPKPDPVLSISKVQLDRVKRYREDVAYHATCGQAADAEWKRVIAEELRGLGRSLASGFCGECGMVGSIGQAPRCPCAMAQQQAQQQQAQAQQVQR